MLIAETLENTEKVQRSKEKTSSFWSTEVTTIYFLGGPYTTYTTLVSRFSHF